jgi:hypothetical protein
MYVEASKLHTYFILIEVTRIGRVAAFNRRGQYGNFI